MSTSRAITLERLDRCARCHWDLRPGDAAVWDAERGELRCVECETPASPPPFVLGLQDAAGPSRAERREARLRALLGDLAG